MPQPSFEEIHDFRKDAHGADLDSMSSAAVIVGLTAVATVFVLALAVPSIAERLSARPDICVGTAYECVAATQDAR